jgi:hypothetical protein
MTPDINLAGLATLSFLGLFFPGVGMFEHRRKQQRRRKAHADAQLAQLVIEETKRMQRMADHICVIDTETGQIEVTPEGNVYIRCAFAECQQPIYMGRASLHELSQYDRKEQRR